MTIEIEPCEDAAVIAPMLRVLREALAPALFEERLWRALQSGYRVLIAREADKTQGLLGYRITQDVFWGKTLYIDDLVVQPETRGQGHGAALLKAAKELARAEHCDHIRLCSGLTRAQAHRFYEQNGFGRTSLQFFFAVDDGEN